MRAFVPGTLAGYKPAPLVCYDHRTDLGYTKGLERHYSSRSIRASVNRQQSTGKEDSNFFQYTQLASGSASRLMSDECFEPNESAYAV